MLFCFDKMYANLFLIRCLMLLEMLLRSLCQDLEVPHVDMEYLYSEVREGPEEVLQQQHQHQPHDETVNEEIGGNDKNSTELKSPTMEDESWVSDAVRDVAYYLRAHKFNEWDRRYHRSFDSNVSRHYFKGFPRPPLRELHWDVKKNCENDFLDCLKYLQDMVLKSPLKRNDDTSEVLQDRKLKIANISLQIESLDIECRKMFSRDNYTGIPFQGPIERYQWRTTASYYMCWYVMQGLPTLELFGGACDNFASCSDPEFGISNKDPRADDNFPYRCALYSFCPDPCCPIKHIKNFQDCWNNETNPCYEDNLNGNKTCTFERSQNKDFSDIVLNRWNVSCSCPLAGFKWDSRFGICVDIDECEAPISPCDNMTQSCLNLPGNFTCVCHWGFEWNYETNTCVESLGLTIINEDFRFENETDDDGLFASWFNCGSCNYLNICLLYFSPVFVNFMLFIFDSLFNINI